MGKKWLILSRNKIIILFSYYLLIFVISLIIAISKMIFYYENDSFKIMTAAILMSVVFSLLGSSIYYIIKLYKHCIRNDILNTNPQNSIAELGAFIYFLIRPIFPIALSLISIVGINSGIISNSVKVFELSKGFVGTSIVLSFMIGFSSGKFLDSLLENSNKFVSKILGNKENNDVKN